MNYIVYGSYQVCSRDGIRGAASATVSVSLQQGVGIGVFGYSTSLRFCIKGEVWL